MSEAFLTITEAVQSTGKSRRTLHRLAQHLAQTAPDHVLREKTAQGMIWRIHQQALLSPATLPRVSPARDLSAAALVVPEPTQAEGKHLDLAQQGYRNLMAMHQEVKVAYEALLHEKEARIQALTRALEQRRPSFWQRLFGH